MVTNGWLEGTASHYKDRASWHKRHGYDADAHEYQNRVDACRELLSRRKADEEAVTVEVRYAGDSSVGIFSFNDEITLRCESGEWGGDDGEFEDAAVQFFKDWYDTPGVTIRKRKEEVAP